MTRPGPRLRRIARAAGNLSGGAVAPPGRRATGEGCGGTGGTGGSGPASGLAGARRRGAVPFDMTFSAAPLEVRQALGRARAQLRLWGVDRGAVQVAEQVLAEVLNNIGQHAYAGRDPAPVRLTARLQGGELRVTVVDRGSLMPAPRPPLGRPPQLGAAAHLPEAGFGWFLIRALSRFVRYRRWRGRNVLYLGLPAGPPGARGGAAVQ